MILVDTIEEFYEKHELDFNNYEPPKLENMEKIKLNPNWKYAICTDGNDVDGMTGGVIWQLTFQYLNIKSKIFAPKRHEGYGLNKNIVDQLINEGFNAIITNDNGIRANEAIKYAKSFKLYVIITDHHLPGDELPIADIIINPHIGNKHLLIHDICGAFVSYIICSQWCPLISLSELAAIATIADMMPIIYYNRTLVKKFYDNIKQNNISHCSLGYLFGKYNLYEGFNDNTLSFKIIPMFNSYSRMTHSCDNVIKFLLSEDPFEIEMLINQLNEINEKRKSLTDEYYKKLILRVVKNDPVIILEDKSINSGLCGLVANKISTEFKKTTFIIGNGVGSGRGPNALALIEQKKDYFSNFGGHVEACGFTLKEQKFDLNNVVIPTSISKPEKYIKMNYNIVEKLYDIIEKISPMPKKPLFYSEEEVLEISYMKNIHSKIKTKNMIFLYFYKTIPMETKTIKISFQLSKNTWNKKTEYQGIIYQLF